MVDSHKRIAGAFLIGGTLVAGAFLIASQKQSQALKGQLIAVPPREHIAITDSNKDGVPDWRDALQNTEVIVVEPVATSTYEKPKTVTGKFAVNFFERYFKSKSYGVFGDSSEELADAAVEKLAEQATDELFTEKDVSVFPSSDRSSLKAYGDHVASILLSHPNTGDNEAIILQDYMNYDDPERLKDLDPIARAYTTMVKHMLEAPVPEKYVKAHLDLTNALNALREDVSSMQRVEEDALYTLIRMKRYQDDVLGVANALTTLFNTLYLQDNIRWDESEPASTFVKLTQ